MVCSECRRVTSRPLLCAKCASQVVPAHERVISYGVRLVGGFEHIGPAKTLIHDVKYRGQTGYLDLVTRAVAGRLPAAVFVPVPRSWVRLVKYGIDPAAVLAGKLAQATGAQSSTLLSRPFHNRRRAGGDHRRPVSPFSLSVRPQEPVVLVDDVLTTGATMTAAIRAVGLENVRAAVVANVVPEVSSLLRASAHNPSRET